MAVLLKGLWIAATVVINNPKNNIASSVDPTTGVEVVNQANIYFFTWFVLFCNAYLVGSFYRDFGTFEWRVLGWVTMFATSLMQVGTVNHLKHGICDADDGVICFRTKYALISSIVVVIISLSGTVISCMYKLSPSLGLILVSPNAAIYIFGIGECGAYYYFIIGSLSAFRLHVVCVHYFKCALHVYSLSLSYTYSNAIFNVILFCLRLVNSQTLVMYAAVQSCLHLMVVQRKHLGHSTLRFGLAHVPQCCY